jgi:hypothetical protein
MNMRPHLFGDFDGQLVINIGHQFIDNTLHV